jgi:hypothetical protein
MLQTKVENRLRGGVFGAYVATLSLLLLIGTGVGSVSGGPAGIMPVLDIGCSLFIVAGTVTLVLFKTPNAPKRPSSREN